MFENISVNDLKHLNNINIIDIRSIEKYNNGHILNAINIPTLELISMPEKYLNKESIYYLYCQKGIQSRKVCRILSVNGYNAVNISGGYESWIINE